MLGHFSIYLLIAVSKEQISISSRHNSVILVLFPCSYILYMIFCNIEALSGIIISEKSEKILIFYLQKQKILKILTQFTQFIQSFLLIFSTNFQYFKQMSDLFSKVSEDVPEKSKLLTKRSIFETEIRRTKKSQKINQLRAINLCIEPHIKTFIAYLPKTFSQVFVYLIQYPQYHKHISNQIVKKIYESSNELEDRQGCHWQILPQQLASSLQFLRKKFYLILTLLENQGQHAPIIFRKYFSRLRSDAQCQKVPYILFDLINVVVKQRQLNWIPFDQLIIIIKTIQGISPDHISSEEIECFYNLGKNYMQQIKDIPAIKSRILKILSKGSDCFQIVKPKNFLKLCLVLTNGQNQDQIDINSKNDSKSQTKEELSFTKSMLKGSIIKILFRQIFYSSKNKLRLLSLDILANLIIQFSSSFMWSEHKINPIEIFQSQIKDKKNSMEIFYAFSEIFLLCICKAPINQLQKIFQNQVDCLDLILYILQNCQKKCEKGIQIRDLAEESLRIFLENDQEIKFRVANILIKKEWKQVLQDDSEIIQNCYKIIELQR